MLSLLDALPTGADFLFSMRCFGSFTVVYFPVHSIYIPVDVKIILYQWVKIEKTVHYKNKETINTLKICCMKKKK